MKKFVAILFLGAVLAGGIKMHSDISEYSKSQQMTENIMKMGLGRHVEVEGTICGVPVKTIYNVEGNYLVKSVKIFD